MTICIYVDTAPVSVGWNQAVSNVWVREKETRKRRREAAPAAPRETVALKMTSKISDENMPRGRGQLFQVERGVSTPILHPSDLSSVPSLHHVYVHARNAAERFEDGLRRLNDSLIGVTAALAADQTLTCLYVFQKRWHHAGFASYVGSFDRNCLVSRKIKEANEMFVLDVAFVAARDAVKVEQIVYEKLVCEFGAGILPQMPVNGVKIVELTPEQEQLFSSFEIEDHPCRRLLTAECGTTVF